MKSITIGANFSSYGQREVTYVNPSDRDSYRHRYVFQFGAYGCTHLLAYANGLDDALEECAAWLAEHAPGHIMAYDSNEMRDLYNEALAELVEEGADPYDEDTIEQAREDATADLTYTESGYLTSYEWSIELDDPTRAELLAYCGTYDAEYVEALRKCERAPGDKLAKRGPGCVKDAIGTREYFFRMHGQYGRSMPRASLDGDWRW